MKKKRWCQWRKQELKWASCKEEPNQGCRCGAQDNSRAGRLLAEVRETRSGWWGHWRINTSPDAGKGRLGEEKHAAPCLGGWGVAWHCNSSVSTRPGAGDYPWGCRATDVNFWFLTMHLGFIFYSCPCLHHALFFPPGVGFWLHWTAKQPAPWAAHGFWGYGAWMIASSLQRHVLYTPCRIKHTVQVQGMGQTSNQMAFANSSSAKCLGSCDVLALPGLGSAC